MGNLAFLGSHQINGVSALHTELMRETVFHDLHRLYPQRISNKTNGVSFRRWLFQANPGLTELLVETLGADLLDTPERRLPDLEEHVEDARLRARFAEQRRQNKTALARLVLDSLGVAIEPEALFDVHIKRIHEYKRQLLNLLHTVALYQEIRNDPTADRVPRVKIFAGKAAASYHQAKLIIKLANDIARTINDDPTVRGLLKLVFLPNYNVSLAEAIIPAADLSEQISTAGLEASGTSNMKFALNGALTIGTLDGANVEMSQRIGLEHMFIFGLSAQQVEQRRQAGELEMGGVIAASPRLEEALEAIRSGLFSARRPQPLRRAGGRPGARRPLHALRRLRGLLACAVPGRGSLARARSLVALGVAQRGADRLVQRRPDDQRIRPGYLEAMKGLTRSLPGDGVRGPPGEGRRRGGRIPPARCPAPSG